MQAGTRTIPCAALVAALLIVSAHHAQAQQSVALISSAGQIAAIESGVVYMSALPHKVVSVKTPEGVFDVAVPTTGSGTPLQLGEKVLFSGRATSFGSKRLIDTREGFLYREADKDIAQMMADMQAQAQAQIANAAASGEPNAVPTMIVESTEQRLAREAQQNQERQRRRIDLLIAVTSLLVAIIALERMPKAVADGIGGTRAILSKMGQFWRSIRRLTRR